MTTTKKHRKISSTIKSRILSESLIPNCVISNLAKSYGVPSQTIYSWRKDHLAIRSKTEAGVKTEAKAKVRREVSVVQTETQPETESRIQVQAQTLVVDDNSQTPIGSLKSNDESQFVELLIQDSRKLALQKASLIFSDFALTLEGRIKSSSLIAILKILEEEVRAC